jgi:hypothetical protein
MILLGNKSKIKGIQTRLLEEQETNRKQVLLKASVNSFPLCFDGTY